MMLPAPRRDTLRLDYRQIGVPCGVVNAHTGPHSADPEVRQRLDRHHERLRAVLRDALNTAHAHRRLRPRCRS